MKKSILALIISGSVLGGIIVGVLIVYVAVVMPKVEEVNVKTQEIVKLKDETNNNVTKIKKELDASKKELKTYQNNDMSQALADEVYAKAFNTTIKEMNEARKGTNIDYVSDSNSTAYYILARGGGFRVKRMGNIVLAIMVNDSFGRTLEIGAYDIANKTYTEIASNSERIEEWDNTQSCN